MLLLTTSGHATAEKWLDPNHGRLLTPRCYDRAGDTAAASIPWAADNDCFNSFDLLRYTQMLQAVHDLPGCLFVAVPDAVGDADRTIKMFHHWRPYLRRYDLPIALVLQDGMGTDLPWDDLDAVFIGGTTDWKLGAGAAAIVAEARARGKWCHMGRVNSARRIAYAKSIGVQSVDGTKWARFRDTYLPGGLAMMREGEQMRLDT